MKPKNHITMILSNAFDPDVRVYKEAVTLMTGGFRVHLLAWDRQRKYRAREQYEGIEVLRFHGRGSYGKGMYSFISFVRFYLFVLSALLKEPPDTIHCHDLDTLPVGLFAAKITRANLIYDAHEPEYYGWFPFLLRKAAVGLEKSMARYADLVFVTNDIQVRKFSGFISRKDRIVNVRNCPRESFFIQKERKSRLKGGVALGWVGYIQDRAGIRQAIDAFRELRGQFPGGEMVFIGKVHPGFQDGFSRLTRTDDRIRFIPHIPYQKVHEYYGQIDIAFMLYENDPQYRLITPTKLYEAMAQGIPVLATNVGDAGEIVQKSGCGFIVDVKKPDEIAQKMRILMSDPNRRKEMGGKGYRYAKKEYRWEVMEKRILRAYEAIS